MARPPVAHLPAKLLLGAGFSAAPTALGIPALISQPFRAGPTFSGRPSGPWGRDYTASDHVGIRVPNPLSPGLPRPRYRLLPSVVTGSMTDARPGGPTAKCEPSPGGLGKYRRSSERRRRGTQLVSVQQTPNRSAGGCQQSGRRCSNDRNFGVIRHHFQRIAL
jgi:hypothetical protein